MIDFARSLVLATRPMSFALSAVPLVVGTAWGVHHSGHFSLGLMLLALASVTFLHAAANVINDVGDEISGADRLNLDCLRPFTGGARLIQKGRISLRAMALWGAVLAGAGGGLGITLVMAKGVVPVLFGLVWLGLALAYALPPFTLASRGLGELAAGVAFAMPVAVGAWLQSGTFALEGLLAAAVVGCWTAAILVSHEMPDITPDAAAGKRTMVVRLGLKRAPSLYLALHAAASALQLALGWRADLPPWTTVPPVLLMLAALAAAPLMMHGRAAQASAIRLSFAIHLAGGLTLGIFALL